MTTAKPDFSQIETSELLRKYRFHDSDAGCVTMDEEMRRMYLLQEIGAELQSRGVNY